MSSIEVCFSPELIGQYDLSGKTTVIVDILRATSCFTAGVANNVSEIVPVADLDECRTYRKKGYLLAGERNGQLIDGFDLGNSPFDYLNPDMKGKKVASTTTNGTKAISLSAASGEILIGSFLNLGAIAHYLKQREAIVIFCAGWKGKVNLEDTLFAGALIRELQGSHQPVDDSGMVCRSAYVTVRDQLAEIISRSEHARRLSGYNMSRDIEYCSRINEFEVVPVVREGKITAV